MSAPFDFLSPENELALITRVERIHRDSEFCVNQVDAIWMNIILRKLLEQRIAHRAELAELRQRVRDLSQ